MHYCKQLSEHTTEGSPKKKCRSMVSDDSQEYKLADVQLKQHVGTETRQLEHDLLTQCSKVNEIQQPSNQIDIVKPKVCKKEKFDFRTANQNLLREFPIAKTGPKVLSLTQHNLEKFLRESDTESSCSSQDMVCNNTSQENFDDLPLYQRYAVTLDDIKKSMAAKVPPNVKGHLANLLEAMDSYCENPDTYFDRRNKAAKEFDDTAGMKEDLPSKNIESVVSNVSVVSDLSNLSSPSENTDNVENDMEGVTMDLEDAEGGKRIEGNAANEVVEAQNSRYCYEGVRNDFNKCNGEVMEVKENGYVSSVEYLDLQRDVIYKFSNKNEDVLTECEVNENICDKQKTKDDICGLEEIDLSSKPPCPGFDNEQLQNESGSFQKVVHKNSKRKASSKYATRNPSSVPADKSVWRIYAPNAIQVNI